MPKTVYTPDEYAGKWKDLIEHMKTSEPHWFCDNDNQDKILFDFAKELYLSYETPKSFEDCLEEASLALKAFYDHRYNPKTRKPRNG